MFFGGTLTWIRVTCFCFVALTLIHLHGHMLRVFRWHTYVDTFTWIHVTCFFLTHFHVYAYMDTCYMFMFTHLHGYTYINTRHAFFIDALTFMHLRWYTLHVFRWRAHMDTLTCIHVTRFLLTHLRGHTYANTCYMFFCWRTFTYTLTRIHIPVFCWRAYMNALTWIHVTCFSVYALTWVHLREYMLRVFRWRTCMCTLTLIHGTWLLLTHFHVYAYLETRFAFSLLARLHRYMLHVLVDTLTCSHLRGHMLRVFCWRTYMFALSWIHVTCFLLTHLYACAYMGPCYVFFVGALTRSIQNPFALDVFLYTPGICVCPF